MRTCQHTHAMPTDTCHAHGMHRCHRARQLKQGVCPQGRASGFGMSRAGRLDNCKQLQAQHPRAWLRRGRGGAQSARGPVTAANSAASAAANHAARVDVGDFLLCSRTGHLPKVGRSDHRQAGRRAPIPCPCQPVGVLAKQVACWAHGEAGGGMGRLGLLRTCTLLKSSGFASTQSGGDGLSRHRCQLLVRLLLWLLAAG